MPRPKKRQLPPEELLNPRQIEFLANYNNPKSETFGNAKQSAIRAGYTKNFAKHLLESMPKWFSENQKRKRRMLEKAEQVLEETLNMETEADIYAGPVVVGVKKDSSLVKIKQDTAKFVTERIGKNDWSVRNELTGANGKAIEVKGIEEELKQWASK